MRIDAFTKALLALIALFLGIIAIRPFIEPMKGYAQAQSEITYGYINIMGGRIILPSTGASVQPMVDMRNGNVWGFVDLNSDPIYIGRYRFEAMSRPVPGR